MRRSRHAAATPTEKHDHGQGDVPGAAYRRNTGV